MGRLDVVCQMKPAMLMNYLPSATLLIAAVLSHAVVAEAKPLPRSTPEAEGVDAAGLLALVEAFESKINAVHSLMLVRHGKVVAEGWWAPYAAGDLHIMYSVSKSFTSTAIGFAQQEGLLNVNDLVLSFFPELAPENPAEQMKQMRIRDLLRMSSGHQNDMNPVIKAAKDNAWIKAFLATPVENKPGTRWVYNSACSYMLAAIVQKVSKQSLEDFLKPRLFEPLGILPPMWGKSPEGVNLGDGGLTLRTEDLAKFGLLYLQKGLWNGKHLLAERWVEDATSLQTSTGGNPDSNWDAGYGYQFWRNKSTGYRADGAFGQFAFVLPKYDAVLAVTSGTGDMAGVMDAVWQYLLPALHEHALPANAAGQSKLKSKLASLSLPVQSGTPSVALAADVSGRKYGFEKNELGLVSASVDFSGADPSITFQDADGSHVIPCGVGRWIRGRSGFQKRISNVFDNDTQGIAASCAWADDHTFLAKLCFHETPYTISARFSFERDKLLIDLEHNLRWGETKRPQLVGKRS
jgi:CubicO group peptidase (beta-lactamase class C family)